MTTTATACPTCTRTGKDCTACAASPTGRCLACRLNHAMRMVEAAQVTRGGDNRVQFTHNGAEVTGVVTRYGRYTARGKGTVDYYLDVRLHRDEARRYRMSEVTGMRPAPLTGELPDCTEFAGTGRRCATCRVHTNVHA